MLADLTYRGNMQKLRSLLFTALISIGIIAVAREAMAQASAQAAGLKLGNIRSISVQPPMAIFTGPSPSASYWQVQVRVTYDIDR